MSEIRILLPTDKDALTTYAKGRLAARVSEPMEREMLSWNARWRGEALDHYLPQGWSFGFFGSDGETQGFILGQPFVFFRGHTQTLWIEHLEFDSPQIAAQLLDTAHRWARDKHLQCVLVENSVDLTPILADWPQAKINTSGWVEIKSARF